MSPSLTYPLAALLSTKHKTKHKTEHKTKHKSPLVARLSCFAAASSPQLPPHAPAGMGVESGHACSVVSPPPVSCYILAIVAERREMLANGVIQHSASTLVGGARRLAHVPPAACSCGCVCFTPGYRKSLPQGRSEAATQQAARGPHVH